ncbi:cytochrome P450 9e2-like [Cloeon dipterum]|uniref:cytochrome P450 9e2-like n=1 Tax=Cloeon dipterum TaxID=197152 RepID=UPI00321FA489
MGLLLENTYIADVVVLVLTAVYLLYWYGTSTFDYWKKKGVPEIKKKVPFFGSDMDAVLLRKQMSFVIQDLYNELDGHKYGGMFSMRRPTLLVRDPELIKQIMVKDFSSFTDNGQITSEKNDPMFAYNIFAMKGDKWKYARSKMAPAFATGKIRSTFPLILEICEDLKRHINKKIESNSNCYEFEAHDFTKNYTTDVVGSCAFGIKCNSLSEPNNQFREMGKEILSPASFRRQVEISVLFAFPKIAELIGIKFIAKYTEDFFRDLILKAFAYREKHPEFKRNDFINLLMQLKKLGEVELDEHDKKEINISAVANEKGKIEFTDTVLTAQAVGFFIDGFETSSLALAFTLHELAMNPSIQDKLREELNNSFESNGGKIDYENIRGCSYLDNILHETLRMYSPAGALARECTKRYTIPDSNVQLEVGDLITIPVYGLHHDPKYFPNPEVFDPDRFTEEAKKTRPAFAYLPFGEGPRQCIGFRFAQAQVKAAIATIVLNFRLEQSEKTEHPVVFNEKNFLLHAKNGLHLKISPL